VSIAQYFADFLQVVGSILVFAIIIRALLSWFAVDTRGSGAMQLLVDITEPILAPLRKVVPLIGSVDISPIIAILLVQGIIRVIVSQIH
jgi:YggT family protein